MSSIDTCTNCAPFLAKYGRAGVEVMHEDCGHTLLPWDTHIERQTNRLMWLLWVGYELN